MKRWLTCGIVLSLVSFAVAQETKFEVDRLFRQASSGEIRFQNVVKPSKDSLIAMADSASKYLVGKLNSTDAREKVTLVEIFRGIGKSATPFLVPALKTENKDQLRTTARCLAEAKDTAAIGHLMSVTTHADFTVRGEAITAIGKSGGGETTTLLLESLLADSIDIVRKCVVYGLGANRSAHSLPLLLAALNDESYAVRLCAYDALASLDSLAYERIVAMVANPAPERQRVLLIRLCGQLKIRNAKSVIIGSLKDSSPVIRGWAVWSLVRVEERSAKSKIETLAKAESNQFVLSQLQDAREYLSASKSDE